MKPNIFGIATKELSQDGFFTWFLQWADNSNSQYNQPLNEAAKDFVRLLLGKISDFEINKVEAGRQWNGIDIWAEINDEHFIGIEDKTNSGEHSEQLERYQKMATDYYKDKKYNLVSQGCFSKFGFTLHSFATSRSLAIGLADSKSFQSSINTSP